MKFIQKSKISVTETNNKDSDNVSKSISKWRSLFGHWQLFFFDLSIDNASKVKRRASMSDLKEEPSRKKRRVSMKIEPRKMSNESLNEEGSLRSFQSAKTNWGKLKSYVKHML